MTSLAVTFADIESAARAIEGVAHRTPVFTSSSLDAMTGAARLYFKCENLQRAGAFKFRGAYNALSRLDVAARARGVVAFSSGNHAQGIALAGRLLGIPAVVVMPKNSPAVKVTATRGYGAEVVLYDPATQKREEVAAKYVDERGLTLIPPFDHPHIIAGQGTAALELLREVGELDLLLVCVGGGGLISGCAIAAHALAPKCRVVGVEPEAGDDATRSFKTKTLQSVHNPQTIADGARTAHLGDYTFPIILQEVADMVTVSDDELRAAMKLIGERLKLVVEPTGALGAAAAFTKKVPIEGLRVGIILSGGNLDLA
jgi:threonine dehydratase